MCEFKNKVALITGASGAIGKDIASTLNKSGASIILCGTKIDVLENIARDLSGKVEIITENINNFENFEKSLLEKKLNVDILVNNAGITKDNLLMRMKAEDIDSVININLISLIKISKCVLKNMMKQKFGRIISISSVVGFTGNPGQVNYCASKSGIIGFTKSLAYEVSSRGITVNAIAPGYITSAMTDKISDLKRDAIISNIPVGRIGIPSDISNAVLF